MNLLKKLIEINQKRLKEMDSNPDPRQLRSTRLGIEIELDGYRELLERWQQGKPTLTYFPSSSLARAMGSPHLFYPDFFMFLQAQGLAEAPRYYQVSHSMGLPDYVCDLYYLPSAAVKLGELPPPVVATVATGGACRIWLYHLKAFAEEFGVPTFDIDTPHSYSEDSIKYMAGQLGEFTKFVEKHVPGLKYDEDRHKELIEAKRIWVEYYRREWELKKHVPLPMSNRDSLLMPLHFDPAFYSQSDKVLEFWRMRVEEMEERAAKGVDKEEKLRVLWLWPPPIYLNAEDIMESRGVSATTTWVPAFGMFNGRSPNWGDEEEFGRKLSPLEEEARWMLADVYRGTEWAKEVVWLCQELSCEALVHYQLIGCVHICSMARMVTNTVERELGLPTIIITGRTLDKTALPPAEFEFRLTEFIDMVLAQKGQ